MIELLERDNVAVEATGESVMMAGSRGYGGDVDESMRWAGVVSGGAVQAVKNKIIVMISRVGIGSNISYYKNNPCQYYLRTIPVNTTYDSVSFGPSPRTTSRSILDKLDGVVLCG